MPTKMVYRICTEEKNRSAILRLAAKEFESFTVQPTLGYYRGKSERSIVIEVLGTNRRTVMSFAERIRGDERAEIRPCDNPERAGHDCPKLIHIGSP